jgi:hypothetical protein
MGCGGGTTGTSPSDQLRFSGYAEKADGSRAGLLTMRVRSSYNDSVAVDSGTDQRGQFEMFLPDGERSLVVDVSGIGEASVKRSQSGSGSIMAVLKVTEQGELVTRNLSEIQIDTGSLCASLAVTGSSIEIIGDNSEVSCPVTFTISSEQLEVTSFFGEVVGVCSGEVVVLDRAQASSVGLLTLQLDGITQRGCSEVNIQVTSAQAPSLVGVFTVR